MSLYLYSTVYPEQLSPAIFQVQLNRLPVGMQQKVRAFRRWQDAYGSLFGKLLLGRALRAVGLSGELTGLKVSSNGRPYLEGGPDFNISHSGNRVVCLLSTEGRVGIDLEETNNIAFSDFQAQFTAGEWVVITRSATPLLTFYHYWTAKESLIKADGRGLQIGLDSLEIPADTDAGTKSGILLQGTRWYIRSLDLFPGYAGHMACEYPIGQPVVKEMRPEFC